MASSESDRSRGGLPVRMDAVTTTRMATRRMERRADLRHVIRDLALALLNRDERGAADKPLPAVFEQALARIVPARHVRLREVPTRYQARLVTPTRTSESVLFDVPTTESDRQVVLEAVLDPGRLLDDWHLEVLSGAALLGTVVLDLENRRTTPFAARVDGAAPLIGSTPVMCALRERVERVAGTDFMTLIEGESGTGKELVARQIHELSRRRKGPFVAVNCAALVETLVEAELFGIEDRTATGVRGRRGKFEQADGGTLFLDEVSDLSLSAQAKLLRTIQDLMVERVGGHVSRRVDVRIVAATNRPLAGLVAKGLFRSDLFYRLSGIEIHVPSLRSRPDDILELARYFLGRYRHSRDLSLSDDAAGALQTYSWPGNVRELERLIERTMALASGDRIELADLPPHIRGDYAEVFAPAVEIGASMRAWGSRYARLIYERCGRNKRKTSRVLGISYHTLDAYLQYAQPVLAAWPKQMPAWVRESCSDVAADADAVPEPEAASR